jgi:hypothetical protein
LSTWDKPAFAPECNVDEAPNSRAVTKDPKIDLLPAVAKF